MQQPAAINVSGPSTAATTNYFAIGPIPPHVIARTLRLAYSAAGATTITLRAAISTGQQANLANLQAGRSLIRSGGGATNGVPHLIRDLAAAGSDQVDLPLDLLNRTASTWIIIGFGSSGIAVAANIVASLTFALPGSPTPGTLPAGPGEPPRVPEPGGPVT